MKYTTQVDDVTMSDMPSSVQLTAQGLDLSNDQLNYWVLKVNF